MHELVIVVPDLYLPEAEAAAAAPTLPGLESIARFAQRQALPQGWRAWLAEHLGLTHLAAEPPACIAAYAAEPLPAGALWLGTAVHCIVGHAGVHLEQRGLLKLPLPELNALATDFDAVFKDAGVRLTGLASGGFLVMGAGVPAAADAMEPARCVGLPMETRLPVARALKRLMGEIEIWLHEHAVNRARSARGELPVSALWLWGGGVMSAARTGAAAAQLRVPARAFARDPYVDGLWCAAGAGVVAPVPARLQEIAGAGAARVIVLVELAQLLASRRTAGMGDALLMLDEAWLYPATRLLFGGACRELTLIANDHCLALKRYDALRFWRRARRGLTGLL